ncbi:hypothetical protein K439DRAFT_809634 [Ramaria rubella]|nr:hypothetical protein K439DRAFT_809634 [Ramaria rubella]
MLLSSLFPAMSTLTRTHSQSHSPPSLPSFAQAFSNINHTAATHSGASMLNLAKISAPQGADMDTLPPIHSVEQHPDPDRVQDKDTRKRRPEHDAEHDAEHSDDPKRDKDAKRVSAVKREASMSPSPSRMELDQLDASPSPPRRPAKKRRVNSQGSKIQPSGDRDSPVSPVVAAFTVPSSDQGALDQVRATISIKQKQKEMIEQRRGSAAGLLPSPPSAAPSPRPGPLVRRQSGPNANSAPSTSPQQQHSQPSSQTTQPHHYSPPQQSLPAPNNSFSSGRRRRGTLQMNGHHSLSSESSRPPTQVQPQPSRLPAPILTPAASASTPTSHSFTQPPPPQSQLLRTPAIAKSTTTRAAPPKPLTLAPHSRHLEPLVHSAPVIGGFGPVRVPELPPIPITPGGRRVSMGIGGSGLGLGGGSGASVAIAKSGGMRTAGFGLGLGRVVVTSGASAVPPTPAYASLASQQQRPGGSTSHDDGGDGKTGFLQLFENFYDSLADSRLLKGWLQEQLAKSSALLGQLEKEKERESGSGGASGSGVTLAQMEDLIERRVAPMRNEVDGLRRRVGELEEMLYREKERHRVRAVGVDRDRDRDGLGEEDVKLSRRGPGRPGQGDVGGSGYVFPERERREEGGGERERERERGSPAGSLHSSPSFDQRRLSTSAVRLESGPSHPNANATSHSHPHPHSHSHTHVHPVFPLPQVSTQHRPSPLGMERERERERDTSRSYDRRRPAAEGSASTSVSNGRHDALPPLRAPSA